MDLQKSIIEFANKKSIEIICIDALDIVTKYMNDETFLKTIGLNDTIRFAADHVMTPNDVVIKVTSEYYELKDVYPYKIKQEIMNQMSELEHHLEGYGFKLNLDGGNLDDMFEIDEICENDIIDMTLTFYIEIEFPMDRRENIINNLLAQTRQVLKDELEVSVFNLLTNKE